MAGTTTIYDVITRYHVDQKSAQGGVVTLEREMNRAARTSDALGSGLKRLAGLAIGAFGIHEAKKSLIDYNSFMEQTRIQLAGMMAQAGNGDFVGNLGVASTLMRQMRDDSAKTVGTMQDYVNMSQMIVQSVTMVGGTVNDIREMTRLAVVASRAMGVPADVAARDVEQAMRGIYTMRDPFSSKLLTPMGYGGEEGRAKWKALSDAKKLSEYKRALGAPAIQAMAGAQETTWEGVSSTFITQVQQTMGAAGMPIFKALTAELTKWNTWLLKNETSVEKMATSVGEKLLTGLRDAKDITIFLHDHWKSIAMLYVGMKGAGMMGSFMGGMRGGMGGAAGAAGATSWVGAILPMLFGSPERKRVVEEIVRDSLGTPIGKMTKEFVTPATTAGISMAAKLGVVTAGLTAFAVALNEGAKYLDEEHGRRIVAGGTLSGTSTFTGWQGDIGKARALRQHFMTMGLASDSGLDKEAFARALGSTDDASRRRWSTSLGFKSDTSVWTVADAMAKKFADVLKDELVIGGNMGPSGLGFYGKYMQDPANKPELTKPRINVNINRIEVTTEDPDVFAFQLGESLSNLAKNPTGPIGPLREG